MSRCDRWVPWNTWKSFRRRSSLMSCASCCEFVAGRWDFTTLEYLFCSFFFFPSCRNGDIASSETCRGQWEKFEESGKFKGGWTLFSFLEWKYRLSHDDNLIYFSWNSLGSLKIFFSLGLGGCVARRNWAAVLWFAQVLHCSLCSCFACLPACLCLAIHSLNFAESALI